MNTSEIIDIALDRVGRLRNIATYRGFAATELLLIQGEFERGLWVNLGNGRQATFMPWFLLSEREKAQVTIGEGRLALPTGFLQEWEGGLLTLLEPDGETILGGLTKTDFDRLDLKGDTDTPGYYALGYPYFWLGPRPDKQYYIRFHYYKADTPMTASPPVENAWTANAPDLLINALSARIAGGYLNNEKVAANYAAARDMGMLQLYSHHVARQMANQDIVMGEYHHGDGQ